ncbi:MAG: hypothetical protein ABTQ73_08845 [Caldilineales bacterium]
MLTFDLQLVIFLLLALLILSVGGALWLDRRRGHGDLSVLDEAPFGVLRLNSRGFDASDQHAPPRPANAC